MSRLCRSLASSILLCFVAPALSQTPSPPPASKPTMRVPVDRKTYKAAVTIIDKDQSAKW